MTTDDTTQQLPPESPQPRRLLRSQLGPRDRRRLRRARPLFQRRPDHLQDRRHRARARGRGGPARLPRRAASDPERGLARRRRHRRAATAGSRSWAWWSCSASPGPFCSAADSSSRFILVPFAILVAAGVLVWWFVSGEGPGDDAGDVAKRAALGIGILVLCGLIAIGGAWAAAAGGETVVAIVVIARRRGDPARRVPAPGPLAGAAGGGARGVGGRGVRRRASTSTEASATVTTVPRLRQTCRDTYRLGIGELIVDLRQTDLPAGDVPVGIDLGIGDARV